MLKALDTDNPAPAKKLLAAMQEKLPVQALAPIWDAVRGYDFGGAEAATRQLASACGVALLEETS